MKVKFHYGIGLCGCTQESEVELPDNATDDEIEEEFETWSGNFIDACWWKKDE